MTDPEAGQGEGGQIGVVLLSSLDGRKAKGMSSRWG